MPFMDPAFAIANSAVTTCRGGPIKLAVPVSQAYTSVSFYTRNEVGLLRHQRSLGRTPR